MIPLSLQLAGTGAANNFADPTRGKVDSTRKAARAVVTRPITSITGVGDRRGARRPCPACAREPQSLTSSLGLCDACTVAKIAENYSQADRNRVAASIASWHKRTAATRADARSATLRQQRSRLLRRMRPTAPVPPGVDPLALGAEAIEIVIRMRNALQRFPEERRRLEEIVRRLAWGPD
jgi:hypothetical protein